MATSYTLACLRWTAPKASSTKAPLLARQGNQLVREGAALGVVLAGLAGVEADVFKDQRFAVLQRSGKLLGGGTHSVSGKR